MTNLSQSIANKIFTEDDPIVQQLAAMTDEDGQLYFDQSPTSFDSETDAQSRIPGNDDEDGQDKGSAGQAEGAEGDDNEPNAPSTDDEDVEDEDENVEDDAPEEEGDEGAAGQPSPPPSSVTGVDLNELTEKAFGRRLSVDEASQLIQLQQIYTQNPQQFIQALQQIQNPTPYQQPIPPPGQTIPNQQFPSPPVPATPEYIDPEYAAAIKPVVDKVENLDANLRQFQEWQQQQIFQQQQTQQQQRANLINEAQAEWRNSTPLSDTEYALFDARVVAENNRSNGQLLDAYIAANNGDIRKGTQALLNAYFMADPQYHEREVAVQATQLDNERKEQVRRTRKSTALSGGGGAKPAPGTAQQPKTREQMDAAFVQGIADAMNNGSGTQ